MPINWDGNKRLILVSIVIKLVGSNKNKSRVYRVDKQFCVAKVKLLAWEYLKVFPLQN